MNGRLISTRTTFVLVSLVTIILLVGSIVLSRIVFKAATASATLYFNQATVQVKPDTIFSTDVSVNLSASADITGVQFEVSFDPKILKFITIQPAIFWKQVFSKVDNGKLFLVMVPSERKALTYGAASSLHLANLTFTTLAEGVTSLTFTPGMTLLAVSNTPSSKGVENIIESVLDAQVRVASGAIKTPNDNSPKVETLTQDELVFSSQRIISTSQILTPNSALILVTLEQPARITIAFGATDALGNRADYRALSDQAVVRIAGLETGKRYFYQVMAEDDNATNRVLGQLKSFTLPVLSLKNKVDRAQLIVFPTRAATTVSAYAMFFDENNAVIGGLSPQLQLNNANVTATKFSEVDGLYQATLSAIDAKKQIVRSTLSLNDQQYDNTTALLDPNLNDSTLVSSKIFSTLKFNQKAINLILVLIASLLLLGVAFYKLARAR